MIEITFYCLLFFAGAVFGSFYFTLYLRFADNVKFTSFRKILVSPSSCSSCGKKIPALFLFPVIGYFISGGKCSKCGKVISLQYPGFEILSGIILILIYNYFKTDWRFIPVFLITLSSITLSLIDLKKRIIPNFLVILIFIFSLPIVVFQPGLQDNLYGFLFMTVVFGIILLLFPGSFGGGDFKYAAVIGLLLGLELSILAFEVSVITGAVAGTLYGLGTGKGLRIKIPFGPFLTIAMLISIFYGSRIMLMYHNYFR